MMIPIESNNTFQLGYDYNSANLTVQANISNPVLNCSSNYSSTEFFVYNQTKNRIIGTSCFFIAPIVTSMNLTITGSASVNFTQGSSTQYVGRYDCFGYIFINVTTPKPTPEPSPSPQPDSQSDSNTKVLVTLGIINIIVLSLIGAIALILYCLKKNNLNTPLLSAARYDNYIKQ
jgi:hypothetical protein